MDETADDMREAREALDGEAMPNPDDAFTSGRILIVSFHGWNDAGSAASDATARLARELDITIGFRSITDERYFDYSVTRPTVDRAPTGARRIRWPNVRFFAPRNLEEFQEDAEAADDDPFGVAVPLGVGDVPLFDLDDTAESAWDGDEPGDGDGDDDDLTAAESAFADPRNLAGDAELRVTADNRRNIFIMFGPEPTLQWRAFSAEVIEICASLGITRLVLVGSLLADVPHSRPLSVFVSSEHAPFRSELGIGRSEYSGPTGALSALGHLAAEAGIPSIAVWGSVPHYASQSPSPKAELAIVDKLEELVDVTIPRAGLIARAEAWEREVGEALEDDSDIGEYIAYLERAHDTVEAPEASGEAIAKEFERFLRQDDANQGAARAGGAWTGPIAKPGQQPPVSQSGPANPQGDEGRSDDEEAGDEASPDAPTSS